MTATLARVQTAQLALPATAFTQMVHVRVFQFEAFTHDDLDAFRMACDLGGPCVGVIADETVTVLEENGEAFAKALRRAGIAFGYESTWVPDTENWIAGFNDPAPADQDEWH